ncbi:hypothetical protein JKY72_01630 [Candidatus Gracilibacteria bacterium]|nr:hypothetical protein [Candidatus Gracilibacteria bacterium]
MNYSERDDNEYNAFVVLMQGNYLSNARNLQAHGVDIQDVDCKGNDACQVYFDIHSPTSAAVCVEMVESFKELGLDIWAPTADGRTPKQIIDGLLALTDDQLSTERLFERADRT